MTRPGAPEPPGPTWQPDWTDVRFDHAAAAEAARACRRAARRLTELAVERTGLDGAATLEWRGRYRGDFDHVRGVHQRWTARLVDDLRAQADRLEAAADTARSLQRQREEERARWREERDAAQQPTP